jgi:hypothetical protein
MEKLYTIPQFGDRGQHVELIQRKLVDQGFFIGNIDGSYGSETKKAILHFQMSKGLKEDGIINEDVITRIGVSIDKYLSDNPMVAITTLVDESRISKVIWENGNRGKGPYGYYYGMAISYAILYQKYKTNYSNVSLLTKALNSDIKKDALSKWNNEFERIGLHNNTETDRLRNLFILLFGLGMMESSGRFCCGWDRGKLTGWGDKSKVIKLENITAEMSEAGLFQTSYDIINSVSKNVKNALLQTFDDYKNSEDGLINYFSKGAVCSVYDGENFGVGVGFEFQKLAKECPAFTVEFTALAIRNTASHWNPIIKLGDKEKGLELKIELDTLLLEIEKYVDSNTVVYVPITAMTSIEPIAQDIKTRILTIADSLGQKEKLQKLFDFAPNSKANFWAVVDYNKPSNEKRLFVFNLAVGEVKKYLVSHGINSGNLIPDQFSNIINSNQSSLGIYKIAEVYIGKHGRSLRIDGMENTNDNARKRAIVIHEAAYVSSNHAGRSEGCFVVNIDFIKEVIDNLRDGSYLIAWHQ